MTTPAHGEDILARLYDAADDDDLAVLDQLLIKAGLLWDCRDDDDTAHWTNPESATVCEECGKARPA